MRNNDINTLEFNKILEMLSEEALSDNAKYYLLKLRPYLSEGEVNHKMQETTDARQMLESLGTPPLTSMKEIDKAMALVSKDAMLLPEQLSSITQFLTACKRMKQYLKKAEVLSTGVAYYGNSINNLSDLIDEIERSIRNGEVDDCASPQLRDVRRRIENVGVQIKVKLESILKSKRTWFADAYVTIRNGRYTLPVKKEYKNQISGTVIDSSQSGGTYFIEPSAVGKLQDELSLLHIEEDNEVRKILYTLTALVEENIQPIQMNIQALELLDIIFAKAKLSLKMKAMPVPVGMDRRIIIKSGRHPLLEEKTAVPLDFQIGAEINGVVITGPNTGGKTVALKTIGLLSVMAQCGLHVPAGEGSQFCMHNVILCDIGDGQSITENLSTFSSHITNIIDILKSSDEQSLILLDELGSGTDPAEGMGIAIAILEELKKKGCLFVATTHYPEVKEYANDTMGLVNARMAFDRESLQPLYKLEIGEAGESCALYIAKRLGFPAHTLQRAYKEVYGNRSVEPRNNYDGAKFELEVEAAASVKSRLPKVAAKQDTYAVRTPKSSFVMGDSVMIYPQKLVGIVYKGENEKGDLVVQIQGRKQYVNYKRVKLIAPASEMYPPDYDFSIVFDTVDNRKARHKLDKGHNPDIIITHESEEDFS